MSDLTDADIEQLAALFTANGWSELRVRAGNVEILFSTDSAAASLGSGAAAFAVESIAAPAATPAASQPPTVAKAVAPDPSWSAIAAPNLGTFYRSPKPGSPVFVNVGDRVAADSEICLIEVMKLFTSVQAGIAGIIRAVCADDAELVEAGRILFYIERD